jgi:hypothetical protein
VLFRSNRIERENGGNATAPSLLTGRIFDAQGNRMSPVHANKQGTRYRYYVSRQLQDGSTNVTGPGQRIPAVALEGLIIRRLRQQLSDPTIVLSTIEGGSSAHAAAQKQLIENAKGLAEGDERLPANRVREFIRAVLVRAQVHLDRIELTVSQGQLTRWLKHGVGSEESTDTPLSGSAPLVILTIPARLKRAGKEMKIIVDDASDPAVPDTSLVRLIVRAHAIRDRLIADRSLTLEEIAKSEGIVPSYATRLYRLTLLAPDIISAILSGRHPPELTARRVMDDTRLPLAWHDQRQQLDFDSVGR